MQSYLTLPHYSILHPRTMVCRKCGKHCQHNIEQLMLPYSIDEKNQLKLEQQNWGDILYFLDKQGSDIAKIPDAPFILKNKCICCGHISYDYCAEKKRERRDDGLLSYHLYRIYPPSIPNNIPQPNVDMSEECKTIYNEAAAVLDISPRASAALMRLCLQQFLNKQEIAGNSIDQQTQELIHRGIPNHIIQYIDSCRIIGNNSVHPGEIDLNDNTELASFLFPIMNTVSEYLVSEKKKADQIFNSLPSGAILAVEKRNSGIINSERKERNLPPQKDKQGREITIASPNLPAN